MVHLRSVSLACLVLCSLELTGTSFSQVQRIPGRPPSVRFAALIGTVQDQNGRPVPGAILTLVNRARNQSYSAVTNGEGIFRARDLPSGDYDVTLNQGTNPPQQISLRPGEIRQLDLRVTLAAAITTSTGPGGIPGRPSAPAMPDISETSPYPGLRTPQPPAVVYTPATAVPSDASTFSPEPDRWDVPMPEWQRYNKQGEFPYTKSHWYDPFDRNRLKGDYPIFGQQWFFNFTGTSVTGVEVRRLPVPSGISAARPGESEFFGRGEQGFAGQTFFFSLDLSHGDTSFRPADFRVRFTPAVNLNFLQTRERGLVNINPQKGLDRFDEHVGLQEGFVEAKLHDLSRTFDFVSVRAGIQQFNSDFRGFLFSENQPGIRIFGNLRSNRINYNLAYFYFLEKDTNSDLNTFDPRHQQVYIANLYIQDFLAKGYTTEFSFHYNRDDPTVHFDENGFLVRPEPVGLVVNRGIQTHGIRAYYLGWASNGHIGRLNVSHAFYQALGHDTFNTIAARPVDINARMAAVELSVDKDWMRFRGSFLYQSGDGSNRSGFSRTDGTAHGFDTIVDDADFAGGDFSFFDREGIRLTGTGIALTNPGSLFASLRSNKFEGQANFVNPGLFLFNLGADFDLTPKIRFFTNANYLRFDRTEPLELLLFQGHIRHALGTDLGMGIEYRPPLTENVVLTAGVSSLIPAVGFQQIFNSKVLPAGFARMTLRF